MGRSLVLNPGRIALKVGNTPYLYSTEVKTMWNVPSKERLDRIPRLYATEGIPLGEKTIHLHFFLGGCDWYIAEYDGEDLFWGYAILNADYQNAEWGYISFQELKDLKVAMGIEVDCEREEFWRQKKAREIEKIVESGGLGRSKASSQVPAANQY